MNAPDRGVRIIAIDELAALMQLQPGVTRHGKTSAAEAAWISRQADRTDLQHPMLDDLSRAAFEDAAAAQARTNDHPKGADAVTTVRQQYAAILRDAADIVAHYGITPESAEKIFDYDPDDVWLSHTPGTWDGLIVDGSPISVSAPGALILAHHPDPYGWLLPEVWTGPLLEDYAAIPVFALWLAVFKYGKPTGSSAHTINDWAAGLDEKVVAHYLNEAAGDLGSGKFPVVCAECREHFAWDKPLRHIPAGTGVVTDGVGWLILHDGTACCPARDTSHDRSRTAMLDGRPPVLVTAKEAP